MRLEEAGSAQDLGNVKRKLEAWRSKYGGPGRKVPEFLWAEVVPVAKRRGVDEVARALRLRIESVATRVREEAGESSKALGKAEAPAFLELGALPFSPGITIEVEGEKIRIRLPRVGSPAEVAELVRGLVGGRR